MLKRILSYAGRFGRVVWSAVRATTRGSTPTWARAPGSPSPRAEVPRD